MKPVKQEKARKKQQVSSKSKGASKQRRFWRLDPDMYQLRKPCHGNERYLVKEAIEKDEGEVLSFSEQKEKTKKGSLSFSENESLMESHDGNLALQIKLSPDTSTGGWQAD